MKHEGRTGKHRFRAFCAFAVNSIPLLAGLALPALSPPDAAAAVFSVQPGLTVSGEYNDNLFLTGTDRVRDTVTRVMPFFHLHYGSDFWQWEADYACDYRHYSEGNRDDETVRLLDVMNRTELLKNHVIIEMTDRYNKASLDATRDYAGESSFVNQSETNIFTFHPHIIFRSDASFSGTIGYVYQDTWYKDPSAAGTESKTGHAETMTQLSSRATFTAGVRRTGLASDPLTFDKTDIYAAPAYAYAPGSSLFVAGGRSRIGFREGRPETRTFWNAGLTHHYSTVTVSIESGSNFIPDPLRVLLRKDRVSATIRKETVRTVLEISGTGTDYRDPISERLESTVNRVGTQARHALSPRTSVSLDLAEDRRKQDPVRQRLVSGGARLEHRLAEQVTLAGEYRRSVSRSGGQSSLDYENNRWLIEITGRF